MDFDLLSTMSPKEQNAAMANYAMITARFQTYKESLKTDETYVRPIKKARFDVEDEDSDEERYEIKRKKPRVGEAKLEAKPASEAKQEAKQEAKVKPPPTGELTGKVKTASKPVKAKPTGDTNSAGTPDSGAGAFPLLEHPQVFIDAEDAKGEVFSEFSPSNLKHTNSKYRAWMTGAPPTMEFDGSKQRGRRPEMYKNNEQMYFMYRNRWMAICKAERLNKPYGVGKTSLNVQADAIDCAEDHGADEEADDDDGADDGADDDEADEDIDDDSEPEHADDEEAKPMAEQEKPVAKPVEPEKPVAKPVAEQEKPVAKPVAEQEKPVAKPVEPINVYDDTDEESINIEPTMPVAPVNKSEIQEWKDRGEWSSVDALIKAACDFYGDDINVDLLIKIVGGIFPDQEYVETLCKFCGPKRVIESQIIGKQVKDILTFMINIMIQKKYAKIAVPHMPEVRAAFPSVDPHIMEACNTMFTDRHSDVKSSLSL
jgi:hypothetical protein